MSARVGWRQFSKVVMLSSVVKLRQLCRGAEDSEGILGYRFCAVSFYEEPIPFKWTKHADEGLVSIDRFATRTATAHIQGEDDFAWIMPPED